MKKKILLFIIIPILIISCIAGACFIFNRSKEQPHVCEQLVYTSTEFKNRAYSLGSGLKGDETIYISNKSIRLKSSMLTNFNTSSKGKKYAKITYNGKEYFYPYYVVCCKNDTSLNCISNINNLMPTYYVNEKLNLDNTSINFYELNNGYIEQQKIPLTTSMIKNFNTTKVGTKNLTITYKECSTDFTYHVKQMPTEHVTANSFTLGKYYSTNTTEESEHFIIEIEAGSYLTKDYKTYIEKIYSIEEKVTGLKFMPQKIKISVNRTNFPSCGGDIIYMDASELGCVGSYAFIHELAHSLDYSQQNTFLLTDTLIEGFATYVGYLTLKEIAQNYPELRSTGSYEKALDDCDSLSYQMYFYDFESKILNLKRDELSGNSQYEAGARFFAYLHHRYNDFCGWMTKTQFNTNDLKIWKSLIKGYYNNQNIFKEFYSYEQSFGDKYSVLLGEDNLKKYKNEGLMYYAAIDYTNEYKVNYYVNFSLKLESQGLISLIYKDLYINIDSAKHQLTTSNIAFTDLTLKTETDITIELYDSTGKLIRTVTDTNTAFSVTDVSFIKLVGSGFASLNLTY